MQQTAKIYLFKEAAVTLAYIWPGQKCKMQILKEVSFQEH